MPPAAAAPAPAAPPADDDPLPAPAAITAADYYVSTVVGANVPIGTKSIPAGSPAVAALGTLFKWEAPAQATFNFARLLDKS